jgi:tight adherence protein B
MDTYYALFLIAGFLAVVMLLEGFFLLWNDTGSPEIRRIRERLHLLATGESHASAGVLVRERKLSNIRFVHDVLAAIPRSGSLDRLLQQAGASQTLAVLLATSTLLALVGMVVAAALGWWWQWVLLAGVLFALAPVLRLRWLRARRLEKIGAQLPDTLDLISRALRAGHAFSSALSMVGSQAQEPIASEFKTTFDEINFGISTKQALLNLANRVPLTDLRYFVIAVSIQLETGGNLAGLLGILATMIRERFKLLNKIRVLAAEGKLSAYILVALPFVVAGAIQVLNPKYMGLLFSDPAGFNIVVTALVMMALGVLLLWRLTKIRV